MGEFSPGSTHFGQRPAGYGRGCRFEPSGAGRERLGGETGFGVHSDEEPQEDDVRAHGRRGCAIDLCDRCGEDVPQVVEMEYRGTTGFCGDSRLAGSLEHPRGCQEERRGEPSFRVCFDVIW